MKLETHKYNHRVIAGYGETSCITVARYRDAEKRDRYNETTKLDGYRLEISSIISSTVIIKRSAGLSHGPDRSHAIPLSRRGKGAKLRRRRGAILDTQSCVSFRRLLLGESENPTRIAPIARNYRDASLKCRTRAASERTLFQLPN